MRGTRFFEMRFCVFVGKREVREILREDLERKRDVRIWAVGFFRLGRLDFYLSFSLFF